jgi:hypothetical protein
MRRRRTGRDSNLRRAFESHKRHDADEFETNTQDKLAAAG